MPDREICGSALCTSKVGLMGSHFTSLKSGFAHSRLSPILYFQPLLSKMPSVVILPRWIMPALFCADTLLVKKIKKSKMTDRIFIINRFKFSAPHLNLDINSPKKMNKLFSIIVKNDNVIFYNLIGNNIKNVVPSPSVLSTLISPPCAFTIS